MTKRKKGGWPKREAQLRLQFDALGRELPDPTPVEIPVGFQRPESLTDMVRRLIRGQMSRAAAEEGQETFEEANDFEIEEDDAELHGTEYEEMIAEGPAIMPGGKGSPVEEAPEAAPEEDSEEKESSTSGKASQRKKVSAGKSSPVQDEAESSE